MSELTFGMLCAAFCPYQALPSYADKLHTWYVPAVLGTFCDRSVPLCHGSALLSDWPYVTGLCACAMALATVFASVYPANLVFFFALLFANIHLLENSSLIKLIFGEIL